MRHAEVEERYQAVFGGTIDMEISTRGQQQAASLAAFLHQHRFDALYASPMRRVQQTLAPYLTNGAVAPTVISDLREVDFGAWTGLRWDQIESKFGVNPLRWLDQLERDGIAQAESAAVLRGRLEPVLQKIMADHPGQQIALFCHGGVIRMLLAILLNWPVSKLAAIEIDYASLTQVLCYAFGVRLQLVNFTPWRDLPAVQE